MKSLEEELLIHKIIKQKKLLIKLTTLKKLREMINRFDYNWGTVYQKIPQKEWISNPHEPTDKKYYSLKKINNIEMIKGEE